MFGRKKDDEVDAMPAAEPKVDAAKPLPLKSPTRARPPSAPGRLTPTPFRPEIVRRPLDISATDSQSSERQGSSYGEGKRLIVGREIALNGQINACEKLIVEGRVEANLSDCREIEIADTGMFKGLAEIDVAEISGRFEGDLTARELLLVRSTGKITGTIRFGRLEIERGGEINGNVSVYTDESRVVEPVAEPVAEQIAETAQPNEAAAELPVELESVACPALPPRVPLCLRLHRSLPEDPGPTIRDRSAIGP